jgi:hypothetical protein
VWQAIVLAGGLLDRRFRYMPNFAGSWMRSCLRLVQQAEEIWHCGNYMLETTGQTIDPGLLGCDPADLLPGAGARDGPAPGSPPNEVRPTAHTVNTCEVGETKGDEY